MDNKPSGFMPKNSPAGIIPRPALMKKMNSLPTRHIFISAPGGYGKTVAAMQWLASERGETAKMTAGADDNNPNVFFNRLAQTLSRLTGAKTAIPASTAAEVVQLRFPARRARCRLLIDDLHRVENEEALGGLSLIAARLPGYLRLCLAGRAEPAGVLMETGLFAAVTRDDLLFSPEEAEWLAAEKECGLTRRRIRDLLDAAGGWAMYLSALLSDRRIDGPPRSLSRYLETNVWDALDGGTRDALAALAVPATLTPELCERLTGRTDGRRVLERLTNRGNAFLSRVDGGRYRFHDAFREFLLARLEKMGPGETRRLNDIAAAWFFEQGDYLASTGHYIKNRDHEGINRCMAMTFRTGENESGMSVDLSCNFTVQHIATLPDEFIAANPYLLAKRALAAYHGGNVEEHRRYSDLLRRMRPEIAKKHPDLATLCLFIDGIDPRTPLREYVKTLAAARSPGSNAAPPEGGGGGVR